jgi:prepilin peptidase CpaA
MMSFDQILLSISFAVPILLGIVACVSDLKVRKIPNWIAVVLAATAVPFHGFMDGGRGLLWSLGGLAVGFSVLLVVHLIGGAGAGDVKFMGGVGAWIGPYHVFIVYVLSVVLIALFALMVLFGRLVGPVPRPNTPDAGAVANQQSSRILVPYAVPAVLAVAVRLGWLLLIHRTLY